MPSWCMPTATSGSSPSATTCSWPRSSNAGRGPGPGCGSAGQGPAGRLGRSGRIPGGGVAVGAVGFVAGTEYDRQDVPDGAEQRDDGRADGGADRATGDRPDDQGQDAPDRGEQAAQAADGEPVRDPHQFQLEPAAVDQPVAAG